MTHVLRKILLHFYKACGWLFYPAKRELLDLTPDFARGYILPQRILNLNRARFIPWPVHLTSRVSGQVNAGRISTPGMSPGVYINGENGVQIGDNVYIGPGVRIISANHDPADFRRHLPAEPIRIGNNVWIGANAVILPGVSIGHNVIIGAGAIVTRPIPANSVAAGNPARVIRAKEPYQGETQARESQCSP